VTLLESTLEAQLNIALSPMLDCSVTDGEGVKTSSVIVVVADS
jgi:hypothetical protein